MVKILVGSHKVNCAASHTAFTSTSLLGPDPDLGSGPLIVEERGVGYYSRMKKRDVFFVLGMDCLWGFWAKVLRHGGMISDRLVAVGYSLPRGPNHQIS